MKYDPKQMSLEQYKEIYGDRMEEMMNQDNKNEETDNSKSIAQTIAEELLSVQPMSGIDMKELANDPLANKMLNNFLNRSR